jgi:flagellar biosynthesis protein FlhF
MALVRADLGSEALILSTRRVADGVELTAALDHADMPPPAQAHSLPQRLPQTGALAFHGVPASLAGRLEGPSLSEALRTALRFGALPVTSDGPPMLLVGMPGAGKTLSLARLAIRLVLDGVFPLVITADGRRAGAAEELAAYTRLLGIGLVVATTPPTLARALDQRQPGMPVLIDSSGINPFASAELAELRALVEVARATPVVVMPAGQDAAEAAEQALAFAALGARHLLPTRLDLSRRLGSVLAAAAAADLILTEGGIGMGATDGLAPLSPDFLAERLAQMAEGRGTVFPWHPGKTAPSAPAATRAATRTGCSI